MITLNYCILVWRSLAPGKPLIGIHVCLTSYFLLISVPSEALPLLGWLWDRGLTLVGEKARPRDSCRHCRVPRALTVSSSGFCVSSLVLSALVISTTEAVAKACQGPGSSLQVTSVERPWTLRLTHGLSDWGPADKFMRHHLWSMTGNKNMWHAHGYSGCRVKVRSAFSMVTAGANIRKWTRCTMVLGARGQDLLSTDVGWTSRPGAKVWSKEGLSLTDSQAVI